VTSLSSRPDIDRAIDEFLDHRRVERGAAPATLAAYAADLRDFAAARGTAAGWRHSPEAAQR
jgi:site-specific recombinase XerD